ncbi:G-type lectin S-receptor-like serine/threonine-protein kinase SD2-2 [Chenopodium quinoa]|uniref:G-type lectin S-receptor-like serine/threonine-protein kinase SD2-2 n=1 Tax=Chenopodium quinoa TaxID=63459 RepID=UPI000B78D964|nr:G-type lectin S-receptor-like serine/threonine-protein kinase SD2-2 [Chenopodium quinoa]
MTIILFLLTLYSLSFLPQLNSSPDSVTILRPNSTIFSPNRTFELGFFTPNPELGNLYLGIWYSSLPTRTYVWVANRHTPLKDNTSASLSLSFDQLTLFDSVNFVVWRSDNPLPGSHLRLLDSGNLVLLSNSNDVVWQSFDHPSDTWLPGMNLTVTGSIVAWKSEWDPSPGRYSLRFRPPLYGEIELVYNDTVSYWSTGRWTGSSFANVPEMTVTYIYRFYFKNEFTKTASFGFSEVPAGSESGPPPLTRFQVSHTGDLQQYTWSPQTEYWNSFWARPESRCRVCGLCGPNGVCYGENLRTCECPNGFGPKDGLGWAREDYSGGCVRLDGGGEVGVCGMDDGFVEMGSMSFDEAKTVSFRGVESKGECEKSCLGNCSCIGINYNVKIKLCKNLFGVLVNLRNWTADSTMGGDDDVLYLRVGKNGLKNKGLSHRMIILISVISGLVAISVIMCLVLWVIRREVRRRRNEEEEAALAATHLRVFSYKELHGATRGFSEKLGHGGFGTVFRGTLSDSSHVAVKCLERPGSGGEKEFRAEVCTIGNVQHVNLVRLRGFCSENSHRLLVYEYMHNGPLSSYLKKDGQNMSWDVRFRVAIGTAKALAYLHEECRQCIIHCDIKPENILLDSDYTAKVSDFGLAKLIGRDFSRVLATMRGTWGYVAPEWISGVAITNKADVYSYGMTMLELIGGRRNVEAPPPSPPNTYGCDGNQGTHGSGDTGNGDKWFFPPWAARKIIEGNMEEVVDSRLGVAYDRLEAERLGMVAVWCIQDEEGARPSMGLVVKMLEGVVEVGVPPPPKLLQALVAGESSVGITSGNVVSNTGGFGSDDNNTRVSVDSVSPHSPSSPSNALH